MRFSNHLPQMNSEKVFFGCRPEAEILAPGVIWANLMSCILRILKFRFLRVFMAFYSV
jgi:hypothetical protein